MLNPLADAAQQGETVILLYVHPPAPFLDVAGVVAAVQNMLVQDNAILPIGQAQGFKANDGSVFVGAAFVVPSQSGSDENGTVVYDDILQPISYVNVVATDYVGSGGAVLAFVDYGNNLNDAIAVAQQATNACNVAEQTTNSGLTGGTPFYITALDSLGALTPYAQNAWSFTVKASQVSQQTVAKTAQIAEDITKPVQNFAAVIVGGLVTVLIGLWIADKAIGKAI